MDKICEHLENVTLLYDGVSKKVANILERTF